MASLTSTRRWYRPPARRRSPGRPRSTTRPPSSTITSSSQPRSSRRCVTSKTPCLRLAVRITRMISEAETGSRLAVGSSSSRNGVSSKSIRASASRWRAPPARRPARPQRQRHTRQDSEPVVDKPHLVQVEGGRRFISLRSNWKGERGGEVSDGPDAGGRRTRAGQALSRLRQRLERFGGAEHDDRQY